MILTPRRIDEVCPAVPLKCEQHVQAVLVISGGHVLCKYNPSVSCASAGPWPLP
jgi:hypothetical protein